MLADPEVDIVIILTNPASHYSLTMQALKAGKHVYCEKPLADSLEQANEIVEFTAQQGLFVGAAPDTFLTPEFQTVRRLMDEGVIGKVVAFVAPTEAYADMRADCKDHWHPMEPATLIVKKPGGLSQGFHDITYGFCCTHSYMPPLHGGAGGSGQARGHLLPRVRRKPAPQTAFDRIRRIWLC